MKTKITFSFFLLALLYTAVVVKAAYIQVVSKDKLIKYSHSQLSRKKKIYPKRGHILDRDGKPLAINVKRYNVFTFNKNTKLLSRSLKKMKKHIHYEKVLKSLKKRKGKFTWIARNIDLSDKDFKSIKKLDQIHVDPIFSRMYPNGELASQVLGFVGIDNNGLSGLEYSFEKRLRGKPIIKKYFKDAKGRPIKFKEDDEKTEVEPLLTTLHTEIQSKLESALKKTSQEFNAQKAGAAVMDAQTGEIWAIANYPSYDANKLSSSKASNRKLSFVTDPFEPGSVIKTLTIASALERKIVTPDTSYYCELGRFKVDNHVIKESDNKTDYEWQTVKDILKNSSNIGTTKISFDLGYKKLKEDFRKFGLGQKTNIEINGESKGIFEESDEIKKLRLSNISFGQGIATTGIQMLASYAPFANDGYMVSPTLLKTNKAKKKKRILSKETVDSIESILVEAVENGTGSNAKVRHFTIAGKTSTAQRIDETGKYNGYISGFIGFPVGVEKRFVVFTYVENPKKAYYGNTVAAPLFKEIVSHILYRDKSYYKLANYDSKKKVKISKPVLLKRQAQKGYMPNLIGLDKANAFKILDTLDLEYESKGFGVVSEQWPTANTKIDPKKMISLKFKSPKYD